MVSATFRVDRIPDMLKQLGLSQLEVQSSNEKQKKPANETPAQGRLRKLVIDLAMRHVKSFVCDGKSFDIAVIVDPKAEEVAIETNLVGKAGSELAQNNRVLASSPPSSLRLCRRRFIWASTWKFPPTCATPRWRSQKKASTRCSLRRKTTRKLVLGKKVFDNPAHSGSGPDRCRRRCLRETLTGDTRSVLACVCRTAARLSGWIKGRLWGRDNTRLTGARS